VFEVLMLCDPENLHLYEDRFILGLKPEYNIRPYANETLLYYHTEETRRKISRTRKQKGYRPTPEVLEISARTRRKVWKGFIDPNGIVFRNIPDLVKFCREHHLRYSCMNKVGNKKMWNYKGWVHIDNPQREMRYSQTKTWRGFISPKGEKFENIYNLSEFCRQHGLTVQLMHSVAIGKSKQSNGWRSL
jgi:hypothetical protein